MQQVLGGFHPSVRLQRIPPSAGYRISVTLTHLPTHLSNSIPLSLPYVQSGHIPGSVNVPVAGLDSPSTAPALLTALLPLMNTKGRTAAAAPLTSTSASLGQGEPPLSSVVSLIFYCQSGLSSVRAANVAAASGLLPHSTRFYTLHGGINKWIQAGGCEEVWMHDGNQVKAVQ